MNNAEVVKDDDDDGIRDNFETAHTYMHNGRHFRFECSHRAPFYKNVIKLNINWCSFLSEEDF